MNKPRVLIGTVGNSWLGDLSLGPHLGGLLGSRDAPEGVDMLIEDFSFNPIMAIHKLSTMTLDRAIIVGADKEGRESGCMNKYTLSDFPILEPDVQTCIAQGVMGAVTVRNFVVIASYYNVLPRDTVVFSVEPVDDSWGQALSPMLNLMVATLRDKIIDEATRVN